MDQAAYEQAQNLMVDMRRQIRELGLKAWDARQHGDHRTAYDLELARDDLRRALTKLKRGGDSARPAAGPGPGTCPVE